MREVLKDMANILLGLAVAASCLWLWMRFSTGSDARGPHLPRLLGDPRHTPPKVEIQTLFHGNRKDDEDQI
jgi:hypothetical protein